MFANLTVSRHNAAPAVRVNEPVLAAVLAMLKVLAGKVDAAPPTLDGILSLKGVIEVSEAEESEAERAVAEIAIVAGFGQALKGLAEMRRIEGDALGKILTGVRWFAGLGGPAGSNHFEAGGFLRSRTGIRQPDIQLTFMPLAIKPGTIDDVGMHSFQVHIDLMRPRSLGFVRIRSPDPAAAPSICFNYLADPQDGADLREAVRLTREILAQRALEPYRGEELNPGDDIRSDAQIDSWVRRSVETCYHPVGTCRMGTEAAHAVVDAECRVHGIANLRVIDASVMPSIVSGNTNAPTIMIAEKLSDRIRGRASLPREAADVWIHPHYATAQR